MMRTNHNTVKRFSLFLAAVLTVCRQQHAAIGFLIRQPCTARSRWSRSWRSQDLSLYQLVATADAVITTELQPAEEVLTNSIPIEHFLIHSGGETKNMIFRAPAVAGVSLVQGWTDDATQAFVRAVNRLVRENPILTGHVYKNEKNELWIQSGTFLPGHHDFVRIFDAPESVPNFSNLTPNETLNAIQTHLVPLLEPCELTAKQAKDKLPLLRATLILLPNNYAFYSLSVSHAVGDGVTFFLLLKELSIFMNGMDNKDAAIEWHCRQKATHEFYPKSFSNWDIQVSYGLPFMLGALKNFPSLLSRKAEVILLRKTKVMDKRRELRVTLNATDISSNDIITAALAEANRACDIFIFTENVRNGGKVDGIPGNAGGNFLLEVPVSRESSCRPDEMRKAVNQRGEYKTDKLPLRPYLFGRVGRITSLASIAESMLYKDVKVICTIPLATFISEIPLDVCVIFRYDKEHWGVLHNCQDLRAIRPGTLLHDIVNTEV